MEAATLAEGDVETVESLHAYPMGRLAREDLAWTRLEADPAAAADLWRTALAAELARLSEGPSDPVVLRGRDGATLQRLADVARAASGGGLRPVILAE